MMVASILASVAYPSFAMFLLHKHMPLWGHQLIRFIVPKLRRLQGSCRQVAYQTLLLLLPVQRSVSETNITVTWHSCSSHQHLLNYHYSTWQLSDSVLQNAFPNLAPPISNYLRWWKGLLQKGSLIEAEKHRKFEEHEPHNFYIHLP